MSFTDSSGHPAQPQQQQFSQMRHASQPQPQHRPHLQQPTPSGTGQNNEPTRNLFVAGLGPRIDDGTFRSIFSQHGTILSAKVMLDIHTGHSRGFGFVLFEEISQAVSAKNTLDESTVLDSVLHIRFSPHRGDNLLLKVPNIYVRNIPPGVTDDEVKAVVAPVEDVKLLILRQDTAKGTQGGSLVAYIEFHSYEVATTVVERVHGKVLFPGARVCLLAKMAEPPHLRSVRRQKFRADHLGSAGGKKSDSPKTLSPTTPPSSLGSTGGYVQHQVPQVINTATPGYVPIVPPMGVPNHAQQSPILPPGAIVMAPPALDPRTGCYIVQPSSTTAPPRSPPAPGGYSPVSPPNVFLMPPPIYAVPQHQYVSYATTPTTPPPREAS